MNPPAIAIDGPAASGKSTVAKLIAKELGFTFINTGAMYRAVTWYVLQQGIDPADTEAVKAVLADIPLSFGKDGAVSTVMCEGRVLGEELTLQSTNDNVSTIAAIPEVREYLVALQRKIAEGTSIIMDGRDIGTKVLPDATLKLYITASAEVRAMRRFDELRNKGKDVTYDDVLADVKARDLQDTTRKESPLTLAPDATEVQTDDLNAEEVLQVIMALMGRF